MSSLLAAHVACFQSVCRKRRDAKRRARIEFESFDATANVVVAKVKKEEEEDEEEEEGTLTLMFPVRFRSTFFTLCVVVVARRRERSFPEECIDEREIFFFRFVESLRGA